MSPLGPMIAKEVVENFKDVGQTPTTSTQSKAKLGMNELLVVLMTGAFLGGGALVIYLLELIFGYQNWIFRLSGVWILGAIFCVPVFLVTLFAYFKSDQKRQLLIEAIAFVVFKKADLARSVNDLKQDVKRHIEKQAKAK